jgi:hypothetical protein
MKAPKYVIAPEGCADYLTAGKRYEVLDWAHSTRFGGCFDIIGDDGKRYWAALRECANINGGDWIIPDDEAEAPADDERFEAMAREIAELKRGLEITAQENERLRAANDDRRFIAACHAMQGLLASEAADYDRGSEASVARAAVAQADALLAALKGKSDE